MERELYGREALLDGLAPRLVGLASGGPQQTSVETFAGRKDDLPVIVLTGGRGMGKTVALKQLRTNYRGRVPVALIDCEHPDFAEIPPTDPRAPFWSPATEALTTLGEQLGPAVRGAGAIEFPRLAAGLVAIAATGWDPNDRQQIHDGALRLGMLVASGSRLQSLSRGWLVKITAKFAAMSVGNPGLEVVVETTVESLLEDLFDRGQRSAANWYGDYPGAGGQAKRGLNLLALQFHREGDSDARALAERHLAGALRADLKAAYQGLGRLRRVGRPLVLLDNVQAPLGRRLIEPVLRDRADDRPDPVVVIGALRGHNHPALRSAERVSLSETTHTTPWTRSTGIASGALIVQLPALTPEQVRLMLSEEDQRMRTPPLLARSIHRLTEGRPLGAAMLTKAAGQAVGVTGPTVPVTDGSEDLTPGALLSMPVVLREDRPGSPVATELLGQLVHAARFDRLVVLAAAHDTADAEVLAAARLDHDGGRAGVLPTRDLLDVEHWPTSPDHFIGDPFLRTLLLHRLYRADWREVQETMRDHYPPGDPRRLHHELALGVTENAVAHLRDTFHTAEAGAWLAELRFIASAPLFDVPDERRAVALGRTDAGQSPPDTVDRVFHLRIRRLLHCVWQLTDLLAQPDEDVADKAGDELGYLSALHPTGNEVFWHASREWPLAAREWRSPDRTASDSGGDAP